MDRRKRSRGRQKIAIQRISKSSDCFATFSKRRLGLFSKASELATLCGVDVGVVVYSPTGRPSSFFHPTMESVLTRVGWWGGGGDDTSRLLEACARSRGRQLARMLDGLGREVRAEEEREKRLGEESGGRWWWEEGGGGIRVWLEELKARLEEEINVRSRDRMLRVHYLDDDDEEEEA
ncbi:agamous-like MADS-box protein AGL61 [Andrographis paniculata]|uniref:agamous-like MADS-box protein AGL61 n=1 Tax=Andrographis paniculata TaxID=175694 RepID=UPI0021E72735|nr:agamous-like MADS-box protein AGL61 [Andrographis paniculata]